MATASRISQRMAGGWSGSSAQTSVIGGSDVGSGGEGGDIVAHDLALVLRAEAFDRLEEIERLLDTFDVRPVAAEDDALDRHDLGQIGDVVLPERGDPHVLVELVDRVLLVV